MPVPRTLEELEPQALGALKRLEEQLDGIVREGREDLRCIDDWSVKDVVAVRAVWVEMARDWIEAGLRGEDPPTPAPGYGWNQTPALNAAIVAREADTPLEALRARLRDGVARCLELAHDLDGPDLLEPHRFRWTRTWPVLRWIHASTTAQQTTAATLIRRVRRAADREAASAP